MLITVNGETPFQVNGKEFIVAPTTAGYTLQMSLNGEVYFDCEEGETEAAKSLSVGGVIPNLYFRLKDNVDNGVNILF